MKHTYTHTNNQFHIFLFLFLAVADTHSCTSLFLPAASEVLPASLLDLRRPHLHRPRSLPNESIYTHATPIYSLSYCRYDVIAVTYSYTLNKVGLLGQSHDVELEWLFC